MILFGWQRGIHRYQRGGWSHDDHWIFQGFEGIGRQSKLQNFHYNAWYWRYRNDCFSIDPADNKGNLEQVQEFKHWERNRCWHYKCHLPSGYTSTLLREWTNPLTFSYMTLASNPCPSRNKLYQGLKEILEMQRKGWNISASDKKKTEKQRNFENLRIKFVGFLTVSMNLFSIDKVLQNVLCPLLKKIDNRNFFLNEFTRNIDHLNFCTGQIDGISFNSFQVRKVV